MRISSSYTLSPAAHRAMDLSDKTLECHWRIGDKGLTNVMRHGGRGRGQEDS